MYLEHLAIWPVTGEQVKEVRRGLSRSGKEFPTKITIDVESTQPREQRQMPPQDRGSRTLGSSQSQKHVQGVRPHSVEVGCGSRQGSSDNVGVYQSLCWGINIRRLLPALGSRYQLSDLGGVLQSSPPLIWIRRHER